MRNVWNLVIKMINVSYLSEKVVLFVETKCLVSSRSQSQSHSQSHSRGPRPRRLTKPLEPPSQCPMGTDRSHRTPDDVGWCVWTKHSTICWPSLFLGLPNLLIVEEAHGKPNWHCRSAPLHVLLLSCPSGLEWVRPTMVQWPRPPWVEFEYSTQTQLKDRDIVLNLTPLFRAHVAVALGGRRPPPTSDV